MQEGEVLYWIALNEIKGVGSVTAKRLLKIFKKPKDIFDASFEEITAIKYIGKKTAELILNSKQEVLSRAEIVIKQCEKRNIEVLTMDNELYPDQVKELNDLPIVLYYTGNIRKNLMGVGIVGSRMCSEHGKRIVKETAEFLAENNISVISGMAKGIDGYAHSACVNKDGYTIAFLGSGIDVCYPMEHLRLMEKIKETGLVISEYKPGTKPQARNFPKRNRLIAAFSKKLLVVEAGEYSGALITADYAKKYGRQIFAAPDNVFEKQSVGCNKLILDGATIYISPQQLVDGNFDGKYKRSAEKNTQNILMNSKREHIETIILNAIDREGKTIEELRKIITRDDVDILEKLSMLELDGEIRIRAGRVECAKVK